MTLARMCAGLIPRKPTELPHFLWTTVIGTTRNGPSRPYSQHNEDGTGNISPVPFVPSGVAHTGLPFPFLPCGGSHAIATLRCGQTLAYFKSGYCWFDSSPPHKQRGQAGLTSFAPVMGLAPYRNLHSAPPLPLFFLCLKLKKHKQGSSVKYVRLSILKRLS